MTPTPSAREPQAIAEARRHMNTALAAEALGIEHDDAPEYAAFLSAILAAYDALAAEREAITRLAGSLQDDVAALREAEESLTRQRDEAEQRRIMADECLAMIYQKLVQIKGEESMKSCPPMFYPEAIHNINAERLRAERERDALRGVVEKARQLDAVVYGNRPGGAGSFDERHRAQVEFIDALRALDGEARG